MSVQTADWMTNQSALRTEQAAAAPAQTASAQRHIVLFLSLHLILLAFFLVLNALSNLEQEKAGRVLTAVNGTFLRGGTGLDDVQTQYVRAFEATITQTLRPTIPLSQIGEVSPRGDLDAELPIQTFFPGESLVVRDPLPLLDRLVAVVSTPPEGFRYELDVLLRTADTGPYATGMTPDVARAGSLSRALVARGMPRRALAVGLERGDPRFVRLRFYLVERARTDGAGRPAQFDGGQP